MQQVVSDPELVSPTRLAYDSVNDDLLVIQHNETLDHVRRYHASDGKLVAVYGRVAGRTSGDFKPLDFGDLLDIVADGKGGFYSGGVPSQSSSISKVIRRIAHGGIVDLVKLDCEGAEWEILQDSQAMKCVINLTMEYHLAGEE